MTKLYFHNATTTLAGTLPSSSPLNTTDTNSVAVSGAGTNRVMDTTIGVSQASASWSTLGTTNPQPTFARRFLSAALAAQTIDLSATNAVSFACGIQESNLNSFQEYGIGWLGIWRPSSGAVVGTPFIASNLTPFPPGVVVGGQNTVEIWEFSNGSNALGSVTCADGDVLVIELWRDKQTQQMGSSYTNTIFYDGTTEGTGSGNTISSAAAYLVITPDLQFYMPLPESRYTRQAVKRASSF